MDNGIYSEKEGLAKDKLRVLIVEDEPQLINVMQMHLVKLRKYSPENIYSASNGQEALEKLTDLITEKKTPHFIYADLRMPKLDGAKFFDEIIKTHKEELKSTAMFILTGISLSEEKNDLETALSGTGVNIVYKPFKYVELISSAEEFLIKKLK